MSLTHQKDLAQSYKIRAFTPERHYNLNKKDYDHYTSSVLSSSKHVLGKYTEELESVIAKYTGRRYAIATISGTSALDIAFRVIRILMGHSRSEPIRALSTDYTFIATAEAILRNEMLLSVNDIDDHGHISLNQPNVNHEVLAPVQLFGDCLNFEEVESFAKNNSILYVVEDAAQSFGAIWKNRPSGSLGDISILSFDNKKNLASFGQGGMILTDSDIIAQFAKRLRQHGGIHMNHYIGSTNGVIPEIIAAHLLYRFHCHFQNDQKRRTEIANIYSSQLRDLPIILPKTRENVVHAWQKYVVLVENRTKLIASAKENGIELRPVYDYTISSLTELIEHSRVIKTSENLNAVYWSKRAVSIPINSELEDNEVEQVVDFLKGYYEDFRSS